MELTDKTKEQFNLWLCQKQWIVFDGDEGQSNQLFLESPSVFEQLPDSMKFGVYVDYFKDNNIFVWVSHNEVARKWSYEISTKPMSNDIYCKPIYTLEEARIAAIEKANEIVNEKLKG